MSVTITKTVSNAVTYYNHAAFFKPKFRTSLVVSGGRSLVVNVTRRPLCYRMSVDVTRLLQQCRTCIVLPAAATDNCRRTIDL